MAELKKPIRMCIACRQRLEKNQLLRLRCQDKKLLLHNNFGRGFYICNSCIKQAIEYKNGKELKKLEKALYKECKNKDEYLVQLKEILTDVR